MEIANKPSSAEAKYFRFSARSTRKKITEGIYSGQDKYKKDKVFNMIKSCILEY